MSSPPATRHTRRASRGQTLVFFALASLVLLGALGLAIDAGFDFAQRRAMQNAADAAALAGAKVISTNDGSGASYLIWSTVQSIAQQNGVQDPTDPAQLTCELLTDDFQSNGVCTDGVIPTTHGITSTVRVTVHETHPTFVLPALGISSSSTGATATAQVQNLTTFGKSPYVVCGIDTYRSSNPLGSTLNPNAIFRPDGVFTIDPITKARYDTDNNGNPFASCGSSGNNPCTKTAEIGSAPYSSSPSAPKVNPMAYYYDGGIGPAHEIKYDPATGAINGVGAGVPGVNGPTYTIHDPNDVTTCNVTASKFKGLLDPSVARTFTLPNNLSFSSPASTWASPATSGGINPIGTSILFLNGTVPNITVNVMGANGCKSNGGDPTNCIVPLPVIDNSGFGGSGGGGGCLGFPGPFVSDTSSNGVCVAVRQVMAFYILPTKNNNHHEARLIKDYNILGAGTSGFTPGTSGAILTIRLIR
jgi:Flp pilus assembly protein TadG